MDKAKIFQMLEESPHLPPIPKCTSEILRLLKDPQKISIEELLAKIHSWNQLEGLLLTVVNSHYFRLKRKIDHLSDAIIYLGMQNISTLIIATIIKLLLPDCLGRAKVFNRANYWKHSIGTSVASALISERTGLCDKYTLFPYGLLHDIGTVIMDVCLPNIMDHIFMTQKSGISQLFAEQTIMDGLTHADIGAWICAKWNLPDDIRSIIIFHHKPLLATANKNEIYHIHLADLISTKYYEKLSGLNAPTIINKEIMSLIKISDVDIERICNILPERIEKMLTFITFVLSDNNINNDCPA